MLFFLLPETFLVPIVSFFKFVFCQASVGFDLSVVVVVVVVVDVVF